MIYVTIGSADCKGIPFDRLVREMDRLAGMLGLDVLIQHGTVHYDFRHARHIPYVSFSEARGLFRGAEFVVGHCGAGTIINALKFHTPIIVVPRKFEAGELDSDDHQMQLAGKIDQMPGVRVIYDIDDLEQAVRDFIDNPPPKPQPTEHQKQLIDAVLEFLQ